jgi:ADP-ribose pyrophosphatase YjhB (NUDIX family)
VREGKILLVKHRKDGRSYWLLPGGGCEFGETLDAALERELLEECGVRTKTGRLLFVNESIPPEKFRHVVNFTFLGSIAEGEGEARLNEQDGVLAEVAWVEKEKVAGLTFYPNFKKQILESWDSGFTLPAVSYGNLWED